MAFMICRRAVVFAVAAVVAGVLAASTPALAQKSGGTLIVLVHPEPPTLGSHISTSTPVGVVAAKIYDGLLEYDFDLNPKPALATEWTVSPDGKTVTFKLRQGVKWHDGKPFTSADVQYSIMEVLKPKHPRGQSNFGPVTAVETPDPYTAVFKLATPYPPMMRALSGYEAPIIPRHLYEGTDPGTNPHNNAPVGTGPFVFKSWDRGSHIVLEKNKNYWRSGRPYLDRIEARFIPDASTRAAALEKGEVHAGGQGAIPNTDVKRLSAMPNLEVTYKGYEMLSPIMFFEINNRRPPLDKPEVRRAIAHAIDRQFIIDNIWFGLGTPATGPISRNMGPLYEPNVMSLAYDPAKARALLDEAGLKPGPDGVRFEMRHNPLPFGEDWARMGEYVKQALGQVGIKVTLISEDLPNFIRRGYTDYDYDMMSSFYFSLADPALGVDRVYWSKNIRKGVPFSNGAGYVNPKVDALMEAGKTEMDPAKRAEMYREIQRLLVPDSPVIWVSEIRFPTVFNKKVKDLITSPLGLYGSADGTWIDG